MNWDFAIDKHRAALKRVLAAIVAMAGFGQSAIGSEQSGEAQAVDGNTDCRLPTADCPNPEARAAGEPRRTLPRYLHRAVLRLLRPAEAAARRLVIIAARNLVLPPPQPRRERPRKPKPRSVFLRNGVGTGIVPGHRPWTSTPTPAVRTPALRPLALPLTDPLRRLPGRRRYRPASRGVPRISVPGFSEPFRPPPPPRPDDDIDATRLGLRLAALARALDDLPAEAKRFARWRARNAAPAQDDGNPNAVSTQEQNRTDAADAQIGNRNAARQQDRAHENAARGTTGARRRRRLWPLRSGRPPGRLRPRSRRPRHEIHQILDDLHGLAFDVLNAPDTS